MPEATLGSRMIGMGLLVKDGSRTGKLLMEACFVDLAVIDDRN
jgi:hypothetical protein